MGCKSFVFGLWLGETVRKGEYELTCADAAAARGRMKKVENFIVGDGW